MSEMSIEPKRGRGRPPGPHGTKRDRSVALSAEVWEFLYDMAGGHMMTVGAFVEWFIRKSAAFKAWQKRQDDGETKT